MLQVPVPVLVLVLIGFCSSDPDSERGAMQLRRMRVLAAQPRHGDCWARALHDVDARCRQLTVEQQSRLALRFTHCHLSSSGRDAPSCPEESGVSVCTASMDSSSFHIFTEFFTHTHSICHFLQSQAWSRRAEDAMHRLTESSAGVAQQLESTQQLTESLMEAQSAALQAQQEILSGGERLKETLRDSTEGLRSAFWELSSSSREQQVALSELFNRISFLQHLLLVEAHSLTSCCYHAAAFCASYLLTSTRRSSKARLFLLGLVCLNFYLEKKIHQLLMKPEGPEHQHMEESSIYVSLLRRVMLSLGVLVLLVVCVRYRDPMQQSLQVLQQLKETQRSLQEALQHAERLGQKEDEEEDRCLVKRRRSSRRRDVEQRRRTEDCSPLSPPPDVSHLSVSGWRDDSVLSSTVNDSEAESTLTSVSHNAAVRRRSPGRGPRRSGLSRSPSRASSSPLVYSVLVEDKVPRYSLRNRRSDAC